MNLLPGKLSVLIPAYNEEAVILKTIQETAKALEGSKYEIIVVDDGSIDDTYQEAMRAAAENGAVKVVRYDINLGKGYALRHGFGFATGDFVVFLDADLELRPRQIWTLYSIMEETGADVVIGCKRHPQSKVNYPWHRRVISYVYFKLVEILFGLPIHDTQTGIKLFRREVLERAFPRMRIQRFAHDLELLVAASRFGYRIAEAPVTLTFRADKVGGALGLAKASFQVWLDTLRIFYRASAWKWLNPGLAAKAWIAALLAGIAALSFGIAGFLTRAGVPQALGDVAHVVFLKFLQQPVRDGLLIVGGALTVLVSLLQLNKLVLEAFAHPDQGDLSGIRRGQGLNAEPKTSEGSETSKF